MKTLTTSKTTNKYSGMFFIIEHTLSESETSSVICEDKQTFDEMIHEIYLRGYRVLYSNEETREIIVTKF